MYGKEVLSLVLYCNQRPEYAKDFAGYIKDVVEGLIREFSPAGRKMLDAYYQAHPRPASRVRRGPRQRSNISRRAPPMISSTSSSGDAGDGQPTTARRVQLERRRRRQVRKDAALAEQDA